MCLRTDEVTDPMVRPGGEWVSGIVSEWAGETARTVLRMWPVRGGEAVDLLVDPAPASGRSPSGGVHEWNHDGSTVWVVTKDTGIVAVRMEGDGPVAVEATGFDGGRSWWGPSLDADGTTLWAVADWNEVWSLHLATGALTCEFAAGDGFVVDVDGRGEGRCHTWARPDMAWTTSHIHPSEAVDGVAVQQPRSTRNGATRGMVTDASGVMNVVLEPDAWSDARTVIDDACEHAGPTWGPGQRTWCASPDGSRVAYTRNEDGFGSLWVLDRRTGDRRMLGRGVHGCVSWEGDTVAAWRSGARTSPQVVAYDMSNDGERRVVVDPSGETWSSPEVAVHLVEPTVHRAKADDGAEIPYRLYRAAQGDAGLICWVHGGPIDQWQVTFRPRMAYWLSRGWSVVVPDHRGTTGHGRAFASALEGRWGELDSSDTETVLMDVAAVHGFDAACTVLMGASAGGLTALNVVANGRAQVAGAVLHFPVTDMAELLRGNDPFETHYMPRLVGAGSRHDPAAQVRSPLARADELTGAPILVFHGDLDTSVPLDHSLLLRDAVNSAGGNLRLVLMPGEGHGFRNPQNLVREYEVTGQFLDVVARR